MTGPRKVSAQLITWTRLIGPVRLAFIGSLLLSLIAINSHGTLNRDGMLYVDAARIFLHDGFGAAKDAFSWPFLSIVIAGFSKLSGLGLENAGYLSNALLMAGACALAVAIIGRQLPELSWAVCLVVLALPSFNGYRNEILREYGCWFFTLMAFWLALRWSETPRWTAALPVQLALGAAALFRPEALAFFPALILWQWFSAPKGEKLRRALMIGGLPLIGFTMLVALYAGNFLDSENRLAGELARFSPERFNAKAQKIMTVLPEYGQDQAGIILFFGSLAIIPVKFFGKLGLFIVPILFALSRRVTNAIFDRCPIFAWAFLAHLLVLMIFVLNSQFLAGRYVALLYLFSVPLIAMGLISLMRRYSRWRIFILTLIFLGMLGNVISLSPKKTHFVEAGAWLSVNAVDTPRVYIEDLRVAYYAGWDMRNRRSALLDRSRLALALAEKRYDMVVLEVPRKGPDVDGWMSANGLRPIMKFSDKNGDAVAIAAPVFPQASPSTVGNSRANTASME